jgi:hypothetical protein
LLDLPDIGGTLNLTLAGPATHADLYLNGTFLQQVEIAASSAVSLAIPAGAADQPVDRLELRFAGPTLPVTEIAAPPTPAGWPIGDTGATLPAATALVVQSAGEEVGDFAHIYLNGIDLAPNERGYNLAALDPAGNVLASAVFDTHLDPSAPAAMAAWLRQWPAGTSIAGAVADEASYNLGQDAIDALHTIGVVTDLRGKFRWSHAFIGAAGAPPASALESASLLQPAVVNAGSAPVAAPTVYAAIRSIAFTPAP